MPNVALFQQTTFFLTFNKFGDWFNFFAIDKHSACLLKLNIDVVFAFQCDTKRNVMEILPSLFVILENRTLVGAWDIFYRLLAAISS